MDKMKVVCQQKSSVSTMEVVDRNVGDIVGQSSTGFCLRNLCQITNAWRTLKLETGSKRQLAETMEIRNWFKWKKVCEMCAGSPRTNVCFSN